jgi:glycosyltransferase involved in cell wall biosynthesis
VVAYRLARGQIVRNLLAALPSRTPLQARYCWQPALAHALASAVRDQRYDVVQVEHLRGAPFALHLQNVLSRQAATPPQGAPLLRPVPLVWDAVDCISHLFSQAAAASRSRRGRAMARLELPRTRRYEARLLRQFAATLVTSAVDREALLGLADDDAALAGRVRVVPNGVDLDYFSPAPQPAAPRCATALVVTGKMSYHANVSMVLHLVHDLMPAVWAQRPDVQLYVVGKDPPPAVGHLDPAWSPTRPAPAMGAGVGRVVVTGGVDDLRPYLRQATVAVAPVPYGAGIQNKVLEAMACATPVVTSRQGVAALDVRPGVDLLVAEGAPAFADAVFHLLDDAGLRARLGAAARRHVEAYHTWDAAVHRLELLYAELLPAA